MAHKRAVKNLSAENLKDSAFSCRTSASVEHSGCTAESVCSAWKLKSSHPGLFGGEKHAQSARNRVSSFASSEKSSSSEAGTSPWSPSTIESLEDRRLLTVNFAAATTFGVGSNPFAVTAADFNGDGEMDLATANWTGNNVSVLLGTGSGSFGTATNFTAGSVPYSVTTGDFNGDGKLDLATANYNANKVSVLINTSVSNSPPTVTANAAAVSANEGGTATNTGTFSDSQGNATVTITASIGTVTKNNSAGTWS